MDPAHVTANRVAEAAGTSLTPRQPHPAGIGAGVLCGALRARVPTVRAGRGLAFGAASWLVVDEGLTPLLGFAPGPLVLPWQTHGRGFVGHLVFGAAVDAALEWMTPTG